MKLSYLMALSLPKQASKDEREQGKELRAYLEKIGVDTQNIYQEMEMDSRYVDIHEDTSYSGDIVQLHSHVFYELIFCQSGDVQYILDNKRYQVHRCDLVLIPPGVSHRPLFLEKLREPYKRTVMWLNPKFIANVCAQWPQIDFGYAKGGIIIRTQGPMGAVAQGFRRMLEQASLQHSAWEAGLAGGAIQLLAHLQNYYASVQYSPPRAESGSLLDSVLQYIEQSLTKKITIDSLARHFLVSNSTVSHLFSDKLGISCYHYVVQHRLISAKNAIMAGVDFKALPEACGFADYSSFYRLFKKEYGISPQEYRAAFVRPRD